jgi:hypothetical protein
MISYALAPAAAEGACQADRGRGQGLLVVAQLSEAAMTKRRAKPPGATGVVVAVASPWVAPWAAVGARPPCQRWHSLASARAPSPGI